MVSTPRSFLSTVLAAHLRRAAAAGFGLANLDLRDQVHERIYAAALQELGVENLRSQPALSSPGTYLVKNQRLLTNCIAQLWHMATNLHGESLMSLLPRFPSETCCSLLTDGLAALRCLAPPPGHVPLTLFCAGFQGLLKVNRGWPIAAGRKALRTCCSHTNCDSFIVARCQDSRHWGV